MNPDNGTKTRLLLRITAFLDFDTVRYIKNWKTTFQKLDSFPPSYGWRIHLLWWAPQKEPT